MSLKFNLYNDKSRNVFVLHKIEEKIKQFLSDTEIERDDIKLYVSESNYSRHINPKDMVGYSDESLDNMLRHFGTALMRGVPWSPSYTIILEHPKFIVSLVRITFNYVRVKHIISYDASGGYKTFFSDGSKDEFNCYTTLVRGLHKRFNMYLLMDKI